MFPGSEFAKDTRLGADKVKYVINFGIATIFKNALTGSLKNLNSTMSVLMRV